MKLKKMISLLIVVIILLGAVSIIAFANEAESKTPVARMYICTRQVFFGHVQLYFENLADHEITVGCYKLPPEQGVTVSNYNIRRNDGKGNYYNIDAYCLNKYGSGSTTCAGMDLTAEQLQVVSKQILSKNTWPGTKNCCYFSGTVWNSVSPQKFDILLLPSLMKSQIKKVKCATPKFYVPTKEQCFKQVGTGENATLKQCSNGSFNRYVG